MAKIQGPLFSHEAMGTIGDIITFQRGKAGMRGMLVPKHGDRQTAGQLAQRASFASVANAWNALSGASKQAYETAAKKMAMNGYNLFIKETMIPPPPFSPVLLWCDTFTRANNGLGAVWTNGTPADYKLWGIYSNQARATVTQVGQARFVAHYNGATYGSAEYKADVRYAAYVADDDWALIHVRVATLGHWYSDSGYTLLVTKAGTMMFHIVGDGWVWNQSLGAQNWAIMHELKLKVTGWLFEFYWDAVKIGEWTDTNHRYATGYAGIGAYKRPVSGTLDVRLDDFEIWSVEGG